MPFYDRGDNMTFSGSVTACYYTATNTGLLFVGTNNSTIHVWNLQSFYLKYLVTLTISTEILTVESIFMLTNQSLVVSVKEDGLIRTVNYTFITTTTTTSTTTTTESTSSTTESTSTFSTLIDDNSNSSNKTSEEERKKSLTYGIAIVGSVFAAGGAIGLAAWLFVV